jgi:hypothetical protein
MDFRQSANDHQITTDMSKFSRHQHAEQKRQVGEPTMSDKEVGSILRELWPRQSSDESNEVEVGRDEAGKEAEKAGIDVKLPEIAHEELPEVEKEVQKPGVVHEELHGIEKEAEKSDVKHEELPETPAEIREHPPYVKHEELPETPAEVHENLPGDQHLPEIPSEIHENLPDQQLQEIVVKEVHSPTFVQHFEYVDIQHAEDSSTLQRTQELRPEPLPLEVDTRPDDLLAIVFAQQSQQEFEVKPEKQERYKSADHSEKDQQINDGLTFPKQVQQEKREVTEPTLTEEQYSRIFEAKEELKEPKPKAQKHVRIAEIEREKIEEQPKVAKFHHLEELDLLQVPESPKTAPEDYKYFEEHPKLSETAPKQAEAEEIKTTEKVEELPKSPELKAEDLDKYGTMLDDHPYKSTTERDQTRQASEEKEEGSNRPDEFARVFEDQNREPSKIQGKFGFRFLGIEIWVFCV